MFARSACHVDESGELVLCAAISRLVWINNGTVMIDGVPMSSLAKCFMCGAPWNNEKFRFE